MKHAHFPTAGLLLGMAALLGACTARMAENTPPAPVGAASTTAAAAGVSAITFDCREAWKKAA